MAINNWGESDNTNSSLLINSSVNKNLTSKDLLGISLSKIHCNETLDNRWNR